MDDSLFELLDDASTPDRERLLVDHLLKEVERQKRNPEDSQQIAYGLAGLLGTKLAIERPNDDRYLEPLFIANQLELPLQHHGEATWDALENVVRSLAAFTR
jgi:hypothetical protein